MRTTTPTAPSNDVSAATSATPSFGFPSSAALVPVPAGFGPLATVKGASCNGSASDTHTLGETIAGLAAGLHAATCQLLVLLREFDARAGWNNGFLSCAHWLHWRTGFDLGASREKVRVARALAPLPRISWAMQRGQLSYAKVRALTRVATSGNEAALLDVALAATASRVERFVRAWRRVDQASEAQDDARRHQHRELATWVDDDGMVVIRGRLTPEVGAVVPRAQRRADALGLLAECALSADLDRGTAGDRYHVVVHVDAATHGHPSRDDAGVSRTGDAAIPLTAGVVEVDHGALHVSAETSRRISCDSAVVTMRHRLDGDVLNVGRRTRTIPPAIRRALTTRDSSCRFPGCTSRRCDAHHVVHWADGGATRLENLVLLCRTHHRAVHEGGFRVAAGAAGVFVFWRPDGELMDSAPPAAMPLSPRRSVPVEASPTWDGTRFDVGWAIAVLWNRSAPRTASARILRGVNS